MSVVPENAVTKTSVARFWMFTWFPQEGMRPMAQEGAGEGEPISIEKFNVAKLPSLYNWPMCAIGEGEECNAMAYQIEVCPTSGRDHVQGYAEFAKPCRFTHAQAVLNISGAHCEARKKSREACVKYCSKEESRKAGTFPALLGTLAGQPVGVYKTRQGKRTDISAMVDEIRSGKRAIDQLDSDPDTFVKYSRGLMEVRRVVQQAAATRIRSDMRVEVHWGAPGSGKTRGVYEKHGVENVFTLIADNNACWFDGYEGQDVLLIDDFKGWIVYSLLLKLLDIYPLRCPVKGSFTYAAWTKVYITSNYAPSTWYNDVDMAAMLRRIHSTKQYGAVHVALQSASAGAGVSSHADGFTPYSLKRSYATLGTPHALVDLDSDSTDASDDGTD
jgi:hypothetical protein